MIYVNPSGPSPAKIMLVGEMPSDNEVAEGKPFVGPSGFLLNELLHGGGLIRTECFTTNVVRFQAPNNDATAFVEYRKTKGIEKGMAYYKGKWVTPFVPEHIQHLEREIHEVNPNLIVALGNIAQWALTGIDGVTDWRGSVLETEYVKRPDGSPYKVIPTIHPAAIFHNYSDKWIVRQDMRRCADEAAFPEIRLPKYNFLVRPGYYDTIKYLQFILLRLATGPYKLTFDIETKRRHIACLGIATSSLDAICIPFLTNEEPYSYWRSAEEEYEIVQLIRRIASHPNLIGVGQNFLYDAQYFAKDWGSIVNIVRDTMLDQHTAFVEMPKGLGFLSSMYCKYHRYWKDEGKEWGSKIPMEDLWIYNCKDAVITYEVDEALQKILQILGREAPAKFQNNLHRPVLKMMLRGVRRDNARAKEMSRELQVALDERDAYLTSCIGHSLNPRSPKQMHAFFYTDLAIKPVINRKTHKPTLNDDALDVIQGREPLIQPLIKVIKEIRSIGVVKSTFVDSKIDSDGRIRCSYNVGGTVTYRFSSSEDAFGFGGNLQNLPRMHKSALADLLQQKKRAVVAELCTLMKQPEAKVWDELDKLESEGVINIAGHSAQAVVTFRFRMPAVRQLFLPDPDYVMMDWDLDRADLQVVVWEAEDRELKQMLREGVDLHSENAKLLECSRQFAKNWVHATDYGCTPATAARKFGLTRYKADYMQKRWFLAHPGIRTWQARVEAALNGTRTITNKFGYARFFFGRVEGLLPEALAWIPQSTVGIAINHGLARVDAELPQVELLMQTHDSLAMQTHKRNFPAILPRIDSCIRTTIPYDDPLTIPCSGKFSLRSYGDVGDLTA